MNDHRSSGARIPLLQHSRILAEVAKVYRTPPRNRIDASESDTTSLASEIRQDPHRTGTEPLMSAAEQQGIHWERDWDAAIHRARQERRLLLIDAEKDH